MSNNQLAVTHYLRSKSVQQRVEELLGKRAGQFTTSLMSAVNSNPVLQQCSPDTVLKAAITAASMDLPVNQNLGFAYLIPYKNKGVYEAQFQLGYKGFIQLAQRSGQFKRINVTDVRDGEYKGEDRRSGEIQLEFMEDGKERANTKVVGYLAYFQLLNGFEKELYMTTEQLTKHGKRYSQSYKKGYGLWVDEFDTMAAKTVLKLLISKYGALSTDMQEAILADQSVAGDDYDYVDNQEDSEDTDKPNSSSDENDTPKKEAQ